MSGVGLHGREAAVTTLREVVARAAAGAGGAVVVRGPAGIGKTAALDAVRESATELGMRTLATAGVPSESHLPFAGLHQLLKPLLPGVAVLPEPQRHAIEAAFGMRDAAAPDLFRIALATLDLLVDSAQDSSLLLLADDAHWLDRPSQDVLAFVARRVAADPIALLLAARDAADDPTRAAELAELVLEPLDDDASAALLTERAPWLDPTDRRRVLGAAAGNPLALVELVSDPAAVLPELPVPASHLPVTARLERSFAGRLPDLPVPTRTFLLALAADGASSLAELLRATTIVLGRPTPVEAVDPAVAAQLVEVDDVRVRFRHPLIGSAVYQAAALAQRVAMHGALTQVFADQTDRSVWHSASAVTGVDDDVATRLEAAAARARDRGAIAVSVAALERAGHLSPDPLRRTALLLQAAEQAVGRLALQLVDQPAQVVGDLPDALAGEDVRVGVGVCHGVRVVGPAQRHRGVARGVEHLRPPVPAAGQQPQAVHEHDRLAARGVGGIDLLRIM